MCVSHRAARCDALYAARRRFFQLGMDRTPLHNAVLIYFAPLTRSYALWGDIGVQLPCSGECGHALQELLFPHLQAGRYAEAIDVSIQAVGLMLAQHFPRTVAEVHPLPDAVVHA